VCWDGCVHVCVQVYICRGYIYMGIYIWVYMEYLHMGIYIWIYIYMGIYTSEDIYIWVLEWVARVADFRRYIYIYWDCQRVYI